MKRVLLATAVMALITAPAFAGGPSTPPPVTPPPAPNGFSVTIGGSAGFGGGGMGTFEGASGTVDISKSGYGFTETTLGAAGDLCGPDCQDGSFTFQGAAGESVMVNVLASGATSGTPVIAQNAGVAQSAVTFEFIKMPTPAAPPAGN